MFEAVTIGGGQADAGTIAEALVYYGRVHVVVGRGQLAELVERFGYNNLIRCLDMETLTILYEQQLYLTTTVNSPFRIHSFGVGELGRKGGSRRRLTAAEDIEQVMIQKFGKSAEIRRLSRELSGRIKSRNVAQDAFVQAKSDVLDLDYFRGALRDLIGALVPEYGIAAPFVVDAIDTGTGLLLSTNLDFAEMNRLYHARVPPEHSSISEAFLLSHILAARKELVLAGGETSDLWLDPVHSKLLQARINTIVRRLTKSKRDIDYFEQVEFEGRSFREVINNGQKGIDELLSLLEQENTKKWKQWYEPAPPTAAARRRSAASTWAGPRTHPTGRRPKHDGGERRVPPLPNSPAATT